MAGVGDSLNRNVALLAVDREYTAAREQRRQVRPIHPPTHPPTYLSLPHANNDDRYVPPTHPPTHPFIIHPPTHPTTHNPPTHPDIDSPIHLLVQAPTYLSIYPPIHPPTQTNQQQAATAGGTGLVDGLKGGGDSLVRGFADGISGYVKPSTSTHPPTPLTHSFIPPPQSALCEQCQRVSHIPTHPLTHLPTYLPTYPPILLSKRLIHPLTHPPTHHTNRVFTAPVKEARTGGIGGFFKGVGKGVVGLAVKPLVGVSDAVVSVIQGASQVGWVGGWVGWERGWVVWACSQALSGCLGRCCLCHPRRLAGPSSFTHPPTHPLVPSFIH